ncbi:hypothetical protein V7S43_014286 [Phytophthora oleae]|uniref:Uncharacterized protein n=1 Tax=Phytophthora oleae TaxID=2107226 RepID=A0ABD3F218_9STRA
MPKGRPVIVRQTVTIILMTQSRATFRGAQKPPGMLRLPEAHHYSRLLKSFPTRCPTPLYEAYGQSCFWGLKITHLRLSHSLKCDRAEVTAWRKGATATGAPRALYVYARGAPDAPRRGKDDGASPVDVGDRGASRGAPTDIQKDPESTDHREAGSTTCSRETTSLKDDQGAETEGQGQDLADEVRLRVRSDAGSGVGGSAPATTARRRDPEPSRAGQIQSKV